MFRVCPLKVIGLGKNLKVVAHLSGTLHHCTRRQYSKIFQFVRLKHVDNFKGLTSLNLVRNSHPLTQYRSKSEISFGNTSSPDLGGKELDLSSFLDVIEPVIPSPETVEAVSNVLLTASDLGIWTYWPTGALFGSLTFLNGYLPWWASIGLATCVARMFIFPLMVKSQRHVATMAPVVQDFQILQNKLMEAIKAGNTAQAQEYNTKMILENQKMVKTTLGMMKVPLISGPIFASFFFTLRKMSNFPLESMKTGGMYWFADLTIPDPFYILPTLSALSLFIVMKMGVEFPKLNLPANNKFANIYQNSIPFIIPTVAFFFMLNFNSALLVYWTTNNLISVAQSGILKIDSVREYLRIPKTAVLQGKIVKEDSFTQAMKTSFYNIDAMEKVKEAKNLDKKNKTM